GPKCSADTFFDEIGQAIICWSDISYKRAHLKHYAYQFLSSYKLLDKRVSTKSKIINFFHVLLGDRLMKVTLYPIG
ncbi:MAG: hypothetical protein ACI8VY_001189, partial [Cellvibrionaceae bacterium]